MNDNYIFGKKAIMDAIANGDNIALIKTTKANDHFIRKYPHIKCEIVSKSFFDKFKLNHQEILAIIDKQINNVALDDLLVNSNDNSIILMMDGIENPQNFGAIIRSAVAFNVEAIIFKNAHQSPINDFVIKSSMGAIYNIKLCKVSNLTYAIEKFKKAGYWVYGSALSEKSLDLQKLQFAKKSLIIVGNEDNGISNIVLKNCDYLFKINMSNKVQSLNVSVATGIILNQVFNKS